MYIDYYYVILVVPAILLALWAQFMVKSTFAKYSKVQTESGLTGEQAARAVLNTHGVNDVKIQHISGELTDNFNPLTKTISLSDSVYSSTSVAAVGVAAHEAGHAVQHAQGYAPIKIRAAIIPATQIGSSLSFPLLIAGMILSIPSLIYIGIAFFGMATIFQLVTLPVEFNASARAIETLGGGILQPQETAMAEKTLRAAAMTYVAALAVSLAQLLRLLLRFRND